MSSDSKDTTAAKAVQMRDEVRHMPSTDKNSSSATIDVTVVDANKQSQSSKSSSPTTTSTTTTSTARPKDRTYLTYEQFSSHLARKYALPIVLVSSTATALTYFAGSFWINVIFVGFLYKKIYIYQNS